MMHSTMTYRTGKELTIDEMRQHAPAIFATEHTMSSSYQMVPTFAVVEAMKAEGFLPFSVQQAGTRGDIERSTVAKHLIRFRHHGDLEGEGGQVNEVILTNAHNGDSSYQMMAGKFRFVCANGIISGSVQSRIVIPHRALALDNVIEGACRVLDDFEKVDTQWERFKSTILHPVERLAFAEGCLNLRYPDEKAPIAAASLLHRRRNEDNGEDLWTLFNVVQENMTQGGLPGIAESGRRIRTRAVDAIDSNVRLNSKLWDFTKTVCDLVTA